MMDRKLAAAKKFHAQELDDSDVHVFHAEPHSEYEEMNIEHLDLETQLSNKQILYENLLRDSRDLESSISRLCEMRDVLDRELRQTTQELLVIERDHQGPPRRSSSNDEKITIDAWKNRFNQLTSEIGEFQHTIDKASVDKRTADAQLLAVAQEVAVLQEEIKTSSSNLGSVNGPLGALPMVIGRSITKVPGMGGALANPKGVYDAITHQSKLVSIRDQSREVFKLNKEKNKIDNEIWLERMSEDTLHNDVDRVSNKLADISQKLKDSTINFQRLNIVDALTAYHAGSLRLRAVNKKLVGMLPWFKHHDPLLSCAVCRYVSNNAMGAISFEDVGIRAADPNDAFSNGVTLMEGERSGFCVGSVNLPKDALWSVIVTVTKQGNKPEHVNADQTDYVSVKMGPTVTSLSSLAVYSNVINPSTGTVLYDTKYFFRGSSFAFRFDFSSSTTDMRRHLAVCTGLYEEYELKDLEIVNDPKGGGRTRVLSSYVKMVRVDEKSGKLRETRLLEELIAAEESTSLIWNSDVTNNIMQRYSRDYFLRILRAEILLQQNASRRAMALKIEELKSQRALMADADLDKEARLEQSQKKYLMKKRLIQRRFLDEGKDLIGVRLLVWDAEKSAWRNIVVLDCNVHWVENGTVALVTHVVQEFDEGNDKIGGPMELNLKNFKYFPSPIQIIDRATAARWKEKKKWDDEMQGITVRANDVVKRLEAALEKYVRKEEKQFAKTKEQILEHFHNSIPENAENAADAPVSKRPLKVILNAVLLDIKKGREDIDETGNKIEQAKAIARSRFIAEFIKDRTEMINEELDNDEQELRNRIANKTYEVQKQKSQILEKAELSKLKFKKLIQAQLKARKAAMIAKIQFKPEVFQLAVSKGQNCEHLRTKAWGDNYGTGVKCLGCGRELSDLYKEDSQILGYGSGTDPEFWQAVNRHRSNEQSFRFKNSAELEAVERERLRLEKERREMSMNEGYFYDFQDLKIVYEFDRRHAKSIKAAGIFRQGLQWTENELEYYEASKRAREGERLEVEGLSSELLVQYDPLGEVEAPPPTFRAEEQSHRSQYAELLFSVGRLHNFRKRIEELKLQRFALLSDRDLFATVLEFLHKESYMYEYTLTTLEDDLDRTSKLLSTFEKMQRLWKQASLIRAQAIKDKQRAEMARCGVWEDVNDQLLTTDMLHDQTRGLLKAKLLIDAKLEHTIKAAALRKGHLETAEKKYADAHKKAEALKYCQPGYLVNTRYGEAFVVSYRPTDDMVLVQLPFCTPLAKAYIHYRDIVDFMRARQQAENVHMAAEDIAMHEWIKHENEIIKRELAGMAAAEEGLKRYFQFVDLGRNEETTMYRNITAAVNDAFQITESKKYHAQQEPNIKKAVSKIVADRKARWKEYRGPASGRPKKMSMWEAYQKKKEIAMEMKRAFIYDVRCNHLYFAQMNELLFGDSVMIHNDSLYFM